MTRKEKYSRFLLAVIALAVVLTLGYLYYTITNKIPDKIHIVLGEPETFEFNLPFLAKSKSDSQEVVFGQESNIPKGSLNLTSDKPFTFSSSTLGSYEVEINLFGWLPVKKMQVEVVEAKYLIPGGFPIGIYLEDNGIMVIGTSEVEDMTGVRYEPGYGIVKSGDYILSVNDIPVLNKEHMIQIVNEYGHEPMIMRIRRGGDEMEVRMDAVQTSLNEYKLGVWVRDDTQGIGTLSYIDDHNEFGALGHGISDIDTGELVEVTGGTLYETEIRSVEKGKTGKPGSMSGVIYYQDSSVLGEISCNTDQGVFGVINDKLRNRITGEALPVGYRQEVEIGDAVIRCDVNGEICDYTIKILKVDTSNAQKNKGMVIQVTDERLLSLTGGIVQGMSGSPIIQNNKLIGAVTHVFIQDSTKGYGIFIENMLNTQTNH